MSEKLIARSRELGVLLEVLDPALTQARAVVLEGEPGVGKTALWRYAVEAAQERGFSVIASAPAASEAPLAFAALGDLLDVRLDDALCALPTPQREALEIALLRRDGDLGDGDTAQRMIGVATLGALRGIAATTPLLVAIDDLQWIDAASAAVIRFALRRLRGEPISSSPHDGFRNPGQRHSGWSRCWATSASQGREWAPSPWAACMSCCGRELALRCPAPR